MPQILNAVPLSGLQLETQLKALLAVLVWNAAVTQLLVSVCVCVCVLPSLIEQTLVWNVLRNGVLYKTVVIHFLMHDHCVFVFCRKHRWMTELLQ